MLIEAIDNKDFFNKYADWVEKLVSGRIDVPQFLKGLSPDMAIRLAFTAMGSQSEKTRLDALRDFLDRAGFSKVDKLAVATIDPNTPKEQLLAMLMGITKKTGAVVVDDDTDED